MLDHVNYALYCTIMYVRMWMLSKIPLQYQWDMQLCTVHDRYITVMMATMKSISINNINLAIGPCIAGQEHTKIDLGI